MEVDAPRSDQPLSLVIGRCLYNTSHKNVSWGQQAPPNLRLAVFNSVAFFGLFFLFFFCSYYILTNLSRSFNVITSPSWIPLKLKTQYHSDLHVLM